MKLKDHDATIDRMDKEVHKQLEKLEGITDPDEYAKVAKNIETMQGSKQIEIRNKVEALCGKIPPWATGLFGTVLGTTVAWAFGKQVMNEERAGGVVSSQAINLWDKVIRKF